MQMQVSVTQENSGCFNPPQPHSVSWGALVYKLLLAPRKQASSTYTLHESARLFCFLTSVVMI